MITLDEVGHQHRGSAQKVIGENRSYVYRPFPVRLGKRAPYLGAHLNECGIAESVI
jgi:hypothetical protein